MNEFNKVKHLTDIEEFKIAVDKIPFKSTLFFLRKKKVDNEAAARKYFSELPYRLFLNIVWHVDEFTGTKTEKEEEEGAEDDVKDDAKDDEDKNE